MTTRGCPLSERPKIEHNAPSSTGSVADGGALRVWLRHTQYCLLLFNYQTQSLQVLDRSAFPFSQSIVPFPSP
jgi:hypothetical protein